MKLGGRSLSGVALAAAVIAASGCGDDAEPPRPDARVVVSFEGYVYVDAAAATPSILDRVQHQQQSVVSSLRRRHLTVDARRQGVDIRTLVREPVRVVDDGPRGGSAASTTTAAERVRIRYRFRALGRAAQAEARADLQLGLLQNDAAALRPEIAAACVPRGERDADALAAPWKAFDASLPACVAAASAEQRQITAARATIASGEEVTRLEAERRYLPVVVRIRPRRPHPATPRPMPKARSLTSAVPEPEPAPTATAAVKAALGNADADPLAEAPAIDDGFDDVPDAEGGVADEPSAGDAPTGAPDHAVSRWLEPNYYVLAFVAVALVVLLRRKPRR